MKPSAATFALLCIVVLIILSPASAATIGVIGGTSAPPPELGPYTMTAIDPADDMIYNYVDYIDSPLGGTIDFSIPMQHVVVGVDGWTWSHDFAGDVYWTMGEYSVILQLPAETRAFYLYVQPLAGFPVEISAVSPGMNFWISQQVSGDSGATYFGFYSDGDENLDYIIIEGETDFMIGEFGIASTLVQPVEASVSFSPNTIKLQANNRWITAHLTMPEGYDITQVLTDSLLLNDTWQPDGVSVDPLTGVLLARFDRDLLAEILVPGTVELTVSGLLDDQTPFYANNTVEVIPPKK